MFTHAGLDISLPFDQQQDSEFYWNRTLWVDAWNQYHANPEADFEISTPFKEIYIGHTPTTNYGVDRPLTAFQITNLDTGVRHGGRLTIMNIETKEYWQSDTMDNLYEYSI